MKNISKQILYGLLILSTVCILSACPLMTRDEIRQQDDDRQLKEQVSTIQRSKADSELRYNDIQNDMRVIAGRVDAIEHNDQVAQQNLRAENEKLKNLILTQNDKMKLLEQHVDAVEMRLSAGIQAINTSPPPPSASTVASPKAATGALEVAEGLFQDKEYKKAIVHFEEYRNKHSKGPKAAEATYKIGLCFAELGLKKDAKEFYLETVENFPGTIQAKKAKFRLSQMK